MPLRHQTRAIGRDRSPLIGPRSQSGVRLAGRKRLARASSSRDARAEFSLVEGRSHLVVTKPIGGGRLGSVVLRTLSRTEVSCTTSAVCPPPPETERRPTDEQRRKPIERRNGLSLGRRDGGALRRPEPNRVSTQCVRVCARTGAMAGNTVRSRFPTVLVLLTLVSCTWAAFASADSADGCDWTGRSVFFLSLMRHMAPRVSHEKRPPSVALAKSDWCAFSSTKMAALQNWQSMLSAVSRSLESVPISFPESIQSLMGRRWPTEPNSAITSQHGRVWP